MGRIEETSTLYCNTCEADRLHSYSYVTGRVVCTNCLTEHKDGNLHTSEDKKMTTVHIPKIPDSEDNDAIDMWFVDLSTEIGAMVGDKRRKYGDNLPNSGKILAILWPDGIPPTAYGEALVIVRVMDKFMRRANYHKALEKGETFIEEENPWVDVAGYAIAILYDIARGVMK